MVITRFLVTLLAALVLAALALVACQQRPDGERDTVLVDLSHGAAEVPERDSAVRVP